MFKEKIESTKEFVKRNQTKILVGTTIVSTTAAAIMIRAKVESDKFLKEHDLYEEYYTPEDSY